MAVNRGMLSGLFAPQGVDPEQAAEEKRLQELSGSAMNPLAYTAYGGGAQAGQGLAKIAAGLTGRDIRSPLQKRSDAIEATKAQVAQLGFDHEDPKSVDAFYKQVILILQKQGLAGEALDVDRERHAQKATDEKARLEGEKIKATSAKATAQQAAAAERNLILKNKNLPELARMIDVVESFDPILEAPQRKMRLDALNAMLEAKKKGVMLEDTGGSINVISRASGAVIRTDEKTAAPMNEKDAAKADKADTAQANSYRNMMSTLQSYYDAAVRLYNHVGLEDITGRRGLLISDTAETAEGVVSRGAKFALTADGRDAFAIWKQVIGGAFVAALDDLKRNSPTGSTGLGQTSNIEGQKVQAAKGALSREPDAPQFRTNLGIYIQTLERSADALEAAAPTDSIDPIPLQKKPLTGPVAVRRPAPRATAPAAPAAQPGWSIRSKE